MAAGNSGSAGTAVKKDFRLIAAPLIVAGALLLLPPALYVGSYYLLLDLGYAQWGSRVPCYRWGGDAAVFFFTPLEWADRRLRPDAWEPVHVSPAVEDS